ncbi:MAG: phosphatase PAP2 family protein [Deferribacterales bacterium]|nr:phosphatase PAP2 family protein [Deferribacterales bacterium]
MANNLNFLLILGSRFKNFFIKYKWFLLIFLVAAVLLKAFPQVDIYISNIFFDSVSGFYMNDSPAAMTVYNAVNYVTMVIVSAYVILLAADFFLKKNLFGIKRKTLVFLLVTLILGPGIIVNAVFKENVGRPRPEAIIEFGGTDTFVGPFTLSNACESNCSFPSGHAALGFYFMAFGLIAAKAMRKKLLTLGFIIGVIVSLTRIVQGRHFFSDTLFAFFFVFTISALVYELMYDKDGE